MTSLTRLDPEGVVRARTLLARTLPPTPLRRSHAIDAAFPVGLKLECWQPTGSFKVRGALHFLSELGAEERRRGVVTASAGNHALGVAFAIQALNADEDDAGAPEATLFVPRSAPRAKVDKLRRFPVTVREEGADYDEALRAARRHQHDTGAVFVHAFDDPRTALGAGSVGLEILDQEPGVGTLVVPVGGGGLIAALAAGVKAQRPDVRIVAVQPDACPALRESLRLGKPLYEYASAPTACDGLAGGIGDLVFAQRDLIDDVVTVTEAQVEHALATLVVHDQVLAEPSGAVGLAALQARQVPDLDGRPVVAVITGGNIDAALLVRILSSRI